MVYTLPQIRANVQPYTNSDVIKWLRELTDNVCLVSIGGRGYREAKKLKGPLADHGVYVAALALKPAPTFSEETNDRNGYRDMEGLLVEPDNPNSPVVPFNGVDSDLVLMVDDAVYTGKTMTGAHFAVAEGHLPGKSRIATFAPMDVGYYTLGYPYLIFSHNAGIGNPEHALRIMERLAPNKFRELRNKLRLIPGDDLDRLRRGRNSLLFYFLGGK